MTEHVSHKRALFVVALDESDPARRKADAHAETCVRCARTLRESRALIELIDRSTQPVTVDAQLTARVKQAVFGEAASPAPQGAFQRWIARIAGARGRMGGASEAAGLPRSRVLLLVLGAILSAALAWLDARPGPWFGSEHGLHCMLFENAYALGACAASAVWARSQKRAVDPWTGALVGMSGALFGQLLLRTHCDSAHATLHLFAFHVLGVVIGTALGALATPVFTRPR